MRPKYVLEIHAMRPISKDWVAVTVKAEEGTYEEKERHIPLVFYFFCDSEEEAKALRDEIISRYPDVYEVIRKGEEKDEIL